MPTYKDTGKLYYQDTGGPLEIYEETHSKTGTRYFVWKTYDTDEDQDGVYDSYKQYVDAPGESILPAATPEIVSSTPIPQTVEESLPARILSQESGFAPFETLFHDFQLSAEAVYNFWEQDEETSVIARGVQIVEDIPRYVRLKWNKAPEIIDPLHVQKNGLGGMQPDVRNTNVTSFGLGSVETVGVTSMGMLWTPPTLQPDNFEQIANSISNGYIAPGVIEAVVSVPPETVTASPMPSSQLIDEDEFLSHAENFEGISYSEINAAAWRWESRTFGSQQKPLKNSQLSPGSIRDADTYIGNQFVISPQSQGTLDLKAVGSQGPALSLEGNTATTTTEMFVPRPYVLTEQIGMEGMYHPLEKILQDRHVKVKFVHTNMQGAFLDSRVKTMTRPEHAESMIALAPFVGNLAVYAVSGYQNEKREPMIPSFPVPKISTTVK